MARTGSSKISQTILFKDDGMQCGSENTKWDQVVRGNKIIRSVVAMLTSPSTVVLLLKFNQESDFLNLIKNQWWQWDFSLECNFCSLTGETFYFFLHNISTSFWNANVHWTCGPHPASIGMWPYGYESWFWKYDFHTHVMKESRNILMYT